MAEPTLGRKALLDWLNGLMHSEEYKKTEDIANGYAAVHVLAEIWPDVPVARAKIGGTEAEELANWRLVQDILAEHAAAREIPIRSLIARRPQACLETIQWLYSLWRSSVGGSGSRRDPVTPGHGATRGGRGQVQPTPERHATGAKTVLPGTKTTPWRRMDTTSTWAPKQDGAQAAARSSWAPRRDGGQTLSSVSADGPPVSRLAASADEGEGKVVSGPARPAGTSRRPAPPPPKIKAKAAPVTSRALLPRTAGTPGRPARGASIAAPSPARVPGARAKVGGTPARPPTTRRGATPAATRTAAPPAAAPLKPTRVGAKVPAGKRGAVASLSREEQLAQLKSRASELEIELRALQLENRQAVEREENNLLLATMGRNFQYQKLVAIAEACRQCAPAELRQKVRRILESKPRLAMQVVPGDDGSDSQDEGGN